MLFTKYKYSELIKEFNFFIFTTRNPLENSGGDITRLNYLAERIAKTKKVLIITNGLSNNFHEMKNNISLLCIKKNNFFIRNFYLIVFFLFFQSVSKAYFFNIHIFFLQLKISKTSKPILFHLSRSVYINLSKNKKYWVELTDIISKNYLQLAKSHTNWIYKFIFFIESFFLKLEEQKIIKNAHKVTLISQRDRNYLKNENVEIILPELRYANKSYFNPKSKRIVFIANFHSEINSESLKKLVSSLNDSFEYQIVLHGFGSKKISRIIKHSKVVSGGPIENIKGNFLAGICPTVTSGGIQNKILDYIYLGIPVIASLNSLEGLPDYIKDFIEEENPNKPLSSQLGKLSNLDEIELKESLIKLNKNMKKDNQININKLDKIILEIC